MSPLQRSAVTPSLFHACPGKINRPLWTSISSSAKRQNAYLVRKVSGELELDIYTLSLEHGRCSVNNSSYLTSPGGAAERAPTSLRAMLTAFRCGSVNKSKIFNNACPTSHPWATVSSFVKLTAWFLRFWLALKNVPGDKNQFVNSLVGYIFACGLVGWFVVQSRAWRPHDIWSSRPGTKSNAKHPVKVSFLTFSPQPRQIFCFQLIYSHPNSTSI